MKRWRFEREAEEAIWLLFLEGAPERPVRFSTIAEAALLIGWSVTDPVSMVLSALFSENRVKEIVLMPWEPINMVRYHDRAAIRLIESMKTDSTVFGVAGGRTWQHFAGDAALEMRGSMNVEVSLEKVDREYHYIVDRAPPCPDPTDGGCIGHHCIRCAAAELRAVAREALQKVGRG